MDTKYFNDINVLSITLGEKVQRFVIVWHCVFSSFFHVVSDFVGDKQIICLVFMYSIKCIHEVFHSHA